MSDDSAAMAKRRNWWSNGDHGKPSLSKFPQEAKMNYSMKLTVAERNALVELAHLLNEGLGDIAVMLAEPWLQDAPQTTLARRRAGLRALCNDAQNAERDALLSGEAAGETRAFGNAD